MNPEAEIARLARRRHGMITWEQMRSAGLSRRAIARHVESGWIVRRHAAVYQLGPFPGPFGPEHAAVLACGLTRSEAERLLLALCRAARLPLPQTNVRRAGWEVDAVWEPQRLVVEVDGYRYHGPQPQFERDRRKDADLLLAGYRVLRLTWRRLTREPREVVALLTTALRDPAQAP